MRVRFLTSAIINRVAYAVDDVVDFDEGFARALVGAGQAERTEKPAAAEPRREPAPRTATVEPKRRAVRPHRP
jgi:hypothetical protein